MVFKLAEAEQKSWRRLDGPKQLPKLIQGVKFTDGIRSWSTRPHLALVILGVTKHRHSSLGGQAF